MHRVAAGVGVSDVATPDGVTAAPRRGRRPDPSRTRAAILAQALQSFIDKGFHGTSLRGVAAAVGVDDGTVRHHFVDKVGLLLAALQISVDPRKVIEMVAAGGTDGLAPRIIRTEAASAAAQAERARLRALREDVERDLATAGPAPQPPSYDDMRAEFLGQQSAQLTAYAKTVKRSDGTTMYEAFEEYARKKHAKLTRQGQPVGKYETWRERTTAAQKRLSMSQLNDAPVSAPRRDRGHGFGE